MVDAGSIRERMEVVGSDGERVGRVDHVVGREIELAKLDLAAGLKHNKIPLSWVDKIEENRIRLTLTKDEAKARWSEKKH